MEDNEAEEGLFEEDNVANLVMFSAIDPIQFEDVVKSEKRGKAMDIEVEAIEKNWHMGIDGVT